MLLAIYTLVFTVVFGMGDPSVPGGRINYALLIFSGMTVFQLVSECLLKAPMLLRTNVSFVKKVVFPVEILALVLLGEALFKAFVAFFLLILFFVLIHGLPHATVLLLPLVWLPLCFWLLGINLFLSAVGLFARDIHNVLVALMTVFMLASPVFYGIDQIPEEVRIYYLVNPIAAYIVMTRDVVLSGELPSLALYAGHAFNALVCFLFGRWVFFRLREQFADVV
jgi:lipopolysaccharide transport system permease protein